MQSADQHSEHRYFVLTVHNLSYYKVNNSILFVTFIVN